MSRISDSAISFAEKRSFRAFLLLYTLMALSILSLLGFIYYQGQKEQMLSGHRLAMQLQSESYIPRIREWMSQEAGAPKTFPIDLAYNTAFYDALGMRVEGYLDEHTFAPQTAIALHKGFIHFYVPLASYEIGDFYVVFETKDDGLWLEQTVRDLIQIGVFLFFFFIVIGIYLSRLIFAPMKEAITLLDHFIKDTTHELNTPLQTIRANIEMIDTAQLSSNEHKKFARLSIAAQSISMIYDDLTYLLLNHQVATHDETLDFCELLSERLEYFKARCDQKRLHVSLTCKACALTIDRNRAVRLVDNLLSNAIKYNRVGGRVDVIADAKGLHISDSGIGIDPQKIEAIFGRYVRDNTHEGGFGIGLNIVAKIAKAYGFEIEVQSAPNEGSTITIVWQK